MTPTAALLAELRLLRAMGDAGRAAAARALRSARLDDPMKLMARRLDAAIVKGGGTSIFAAKPRGDMSTRAAKRLATWVDETPRRHADAPGVKPNDRPNIAKPGRLVAGLTGKLGGYASDRDDELVIRVIVGDVREKLADLPDESVHCVVTSPPYFGLRDYGVDGQIGLEPTPDAFVAVMVEVFREVRRVLRKDGTLWLNLGDSYNGSGPSGGPGKSYTNAGSQGTTMKNVAGLKPKDLIGIPWRVAFALQADGWYLRQDIIWSKPNPMPESVTDRCTKAHEYLFLLSKSARYHYDAEAIAEASVTKWEIDQQNRQQRVLATGGAISGGTGETISTGDTRNRRSVWTVATHSFSEAHFATFPPDLIEPCILAGCPKGGTVLDPFGGAGTTGLVADRLQRDAILIELNPDYAAMAGNRITDDGPLFAEVGG